MLERLIRLYTAYMLQDVRSPTPHLAGPPGVGKSTVVQQLADLLGVRLHIVNVARLSPLELEGVQMPVGNVDKLEDYRLHLLTSTLWTQLREGDIVLLDEFMRGFPEVYNGLLDIMTSRQVAGFHLPRVFFVAASNSVAAYDKALEDRLLHLPVADIRKSKTERDKLAELFVREAGLHPQMVDSDEMRELILQEVAPMYDVLDQFTQKGQAMTGSGSRAEGRSVRNLLGQLKLREVQSKLLKALLEYNNSVAMSSQKPQFVVLASGRKVPAGYRIAAEKLRGNPKLTKIQADNLEMNFHLMEMEDALKTNDREEDADDDVID